MKTIDIIEGLNRHIEGKRKILGINSKSHVVLQKEIIPHSTFKIYKIYKCTLWFIKGKKSYKIFGNQQTLKVLSGQDETINPEFNITVSKLIFDWVGTKEYNQVIEGNYETTEV